MRIKSNEIADNVRTAQLIRYFVGIVNMLHKIGSSIGIQQILIGPR